jgi:hypothetical protein
LKCYFCESDARGICSKCSRGTCKEHGSLYHEHNIAAGIAMMLVCNECDAASKKEPG